MVDREWRRRSRPRLDRAAAAIQADTFLTLARGCAAKWRATAPRPRAARRLAASAPSSTSFSRSRPSRARSSKSRGTPRLIFDPPRAAAFGSSAAAAATAAARAATRATRGGRGRRLSRRRLVLLGGALLRRRLNDGALSLSAHGCSLGRYLGAGRASAVGGGRPRWSPLSFSVSRRGVRNQPALAPLCEGFWRQRGSCQKLGYWSAAHAASATRQQGVRARARGRCEAFTKLLVRQQTRSDCHTLKSAGEHPSISPRASTGCGDKVPPARPVRVTAAIPRRRRARC